MQSIWSAAVAAGGLAFIGSLIDFALSRQTKAELKAKLEDWWLRFEFVTWRSFGRREAEAAVALLDRWAGPRLWSWKRWRFSLLTNLILATLAALIVAASAALFAWPCPVSEVLSYPLLEVIFSPLFFAPSVIVTFAMSISVTRYMAFTVGRLCTGTFWDAALFLLLVLTHWLLLACWGGVTYLIQILPLAIIGTVLRGWDLYLSPFLDVFQQMMPHLAGGWFPIPDYSFFQRSSDPAETSALLYKVLVDTVANGLRLGFAVVFLASYLFRPLIQKPISWVWLRIVESTLPFFTLAFGLTGGLLKFAQALLS